jgi:hypothetical protein
MRARGPIPRTDADRQARRQKEEDASKSLDGNFHDFIIDALLEARPGLKREPRPTICGLAKVCSLAYVPWRQHDTQPGYFSVSYLELKSKFGRDKFPALNEKYDLFEVVDAWGSGLTNAYRARPEISEAIESKRRETLKEPGATFRLITSNGRVVRKLPKVPRTRLGGLSERFLELKHARQITPVDLDALQRLDKALSDAVSAGDEERFRILDDLDQDRDFNTQAALFTLRGIIDSALTDIGGRGNIVHEYGIKNTGRLFTMGLGLQSAQKIIKRVALNGCYEYDFSNCHPSLLVYKGREHDLNLPALENYLRNKKEVREGIAERTLLPIATVKRCILIVCYGGSSSGTRHTQIFKEFGSSVAKRLKDDPEFSELSKDAGKVFRAVLNSLNPWRGRIWNVLDLPSKPPRPDDDDIKRGQKVAHILQGIEAQALYPIIRAHYDDLVLYQHDGFTARQQLDIQAMNQIVHDETGYQLELEEEVLQLPAILSPKNRES